MDSHKLAAEPDGKASLREIYAHVRKNLGPQFTRTQWEDVPSGTEPTWTDDIRYERLGMITRKLLVNRNDGIWEITDAGRAWVKTCGSSEFTSTSVLDDPLLKSLDCAVAAGETIMILDGRTVR